MSHWLSKFLGNSHSKNAPKGVPAAPKDALETAFDGLAPIYLVIFNTAQTGATIPVIAKRWAISENAVKNILDTTCMRLVGANRIDLIPKGCLDINQKLYLPEFNRSFANKFNDQKQPATSQIIHKPAEPPPVVVADPAGDAFRSLLIGPKTKISFHRTLRVPEDGKDYPLPAGLGAFPIHRVEDYASTVPSDWLKEGGFFIPLYQKEALFLQFEGQSWHPSIAKVCVGKINAISGKEYSERISSSAQDYVVIPSQKWLDGIASGEGTVNQFVAMPLGQGYTIEAQITDEEKFGGFQILAFEAIDGRFPDRDPDVDMRIRGHEEEKRKRRASPEGLHASSLPEVSLRLGSSPSLYSAPQYPADVSMGVAAGGSIKQQIHKDTYGLGSWEIKKKRSVTIHIVNSLAYKAITGNEPPQSPITAEQYKAAKIPWYHHYDETIQPVKPSSAFKRILGIASIDARRGISSNEKINQLTITPELIQRIKTPDKQEASETYRRRARESAEASYWKESLREISLVIDLNVNIRADDYALRSCCNYHLGRFRDGSIDGSLGLEKDRGCVEALSWRAYCRKSLGEHDELLEDADALMRVPETELIGLELKAEAALLAERYDDAFNDAMALKAKSPGHPRANQIISEANMKVFGRDFEEDHDI